MPPPAVARVSPAPPAAGTGEIAGSKDGGRGRTIRVELPADRLSDGTLGVEDADGRVVLGPHRVVCVVDEAFAARAGNPDASRRRPFGDVPTGRYRLLGLARPGDVALPIDEDTGVHPVLVFRAIDGEAATAEAAGRGDLLLHGGPAEPTLGTLRLPDDVFAALLTAIAAGPPGGTGVTLVVADGPQPATRQLPRPRREVPSGPFPRRPDSAAGDPSPGRRRPGEAADTDLMDGFLLSYMIGWPVGVTPGSLLGTVLHQEEHRRDDSAERLQAAGVPVLRDDGQRPQEQPVGIEGRSGDPTDTRPEDQPRTPDRTSGPHYEPSGGAYDR